MEQPSSKALFTPAKTQRASEAIYNQIYPKIISGELRPGDRLPPERELAETYHLDEEQLAWRRGDPGRLPEIRGRAPEKPGGHGGHQSG